MINETKKLIREVEDLGGMTKAIQAGVPKLRIEESAAIRQARVDKEDDVIVGVNAYQNQDQKEVDILSIDNEGVREQQIQKINEIKEKRDNEKCQQALTELEQCASGDGNLMDYAIEAARQRATVGEISLALENVFGRHKAVSQSISGVYRKEYEGDEDFMNVEIKV